jgi:hypothetical protein
VSYHANNNICCKINFNVSVGDVENIHDMFGVPYNRTKNDLNDKFVLVKKLKKKFENVTTNIWG